MRLDLGLLIAIGAWASSVLVPSSAVADEQAPAPAGGLRAGAAVVDVTPTQFPVKILGYFTQQTSERVVDRLYARALVLDDGATRIALVVVDSCMLPRELCDKAKALAAAASGIPADRMLIAATHTHSAPAAMGGLGTNVEESYAAWLPGRIADAIVGAAKDVVPARIGWTVVDDWQHTFNRRWITRPDKLLSDPFGVQNVRANMHPGYQNPAFIGPAGPVDPALTLLSAQTSDGRPLALLANYSMHYVGASPVSADYFGAFVAEMSRRIGGQDQQPAFVAMMSQGTSGDLMWMDYSQPAKKLPASEYAAELAGVAAAAYAKIAYQEQVSLAMAETKLTLRRRVADPARLEWAGKIVTEMGDRLPANRTEVYAREQVLIAAEPQRELKLQALRIGGLGITAIPNEVFALTGLKLKALSPLVPTMNIELAGGGEGYIPPPEQHKLGGYTTWAARTASLEEQAEPQIVEAVVTLLEKVAGKTRRAAPDSQGPYAAAVLASQPVAYWRLNEMAGPLARDATGNNNAARYEDGVALYLPGVQSDSERDAVSAVPETPSAFSGPEINRAPHFAGGRLRATLPALGDCYSVVLWVWNGLATDARPVTAYLFSRGVDGDAGQGEHLAIGGAQDGGAAAGKLIFVFGKQLSTEPKWKLALGLRRWHQVALVRDGHRMSAYLDGQVAFHGNIMPAKSPELFFGGSAGGADNLEGKLDEVAVYDRPLAAEEVAALFQAAGRKPPAADTGSPR